MSNEIRPTIFSTGDTPLVEAPSGTVLSIDMIPISSKKGNVLRLDFDGLLVLPADALSSDPTNAAYSNFDNKIMVDPGSGGGGSGVGKPVDPADRILYETSQYIASRLTVRYDQAMGLLRVIGNDGSSIISETPILSGVSILESVSLVTDPSGQPAGEYIEFVFRKGDGSDETIYIPMSSFGDAYTAGNGINITSQIVSARITSGAGLGFDESGNLQFNPSEIISDDPGSSLRIEAGKLYVPASADSAVPITRAINTTAPLAGGGPLTTDLNLSVTNATSVNTGVIRLATAEEMTEGTSTTTAVTPSGLREYISDGPNSGLTPNTRVINTTSPLQGGGSLAQNLTLSISAATNAALGTVRLATNDEATSGTSQGVSITPNGVDLQLRKYGIPRPIFAVGDLLDLNAIRESGTYWTSGDNTNRPEGMETYGGVLKVERVYSNYIVQTFISCRFNSSASGVFIRDTFDNGTTWSPWRSASAMSISPTPPTATSFYSIFPSGLILQWGAYDFQIGVGSPSGNFNYAWDTPIGFAVAMNANSTKVQLTPTSALNNTWEEHYVSSLNSDRFQIGAKIDRAVNNVTIAGMWFAIGIAA